MTDRSSILDSVVLTILSLAATATMGGGLLLAGFGTIVGNVDLGEATPIVSRGVFGVGMAMAIGGGLAVVLGRTRGAWVDVRGAWQLLLAATLVGLPVALVLWLGPLVEFWRDVLALVPDLGGWNQDWNGSGLILLPAAIVFAVPGIQAFTAVTVVLASLLTLPLVIARSASILRILFVTVVMTGGLVVAGAYGVSSSDRLMPIAEQTVRDSPDPSGTEQAQVLALLERYQDVTRRSALTLGWVWLGLLVWVPLLTVVAPYRATSPGANAAPPAEAPVPPPPDITSDDASEREHAYKDAARQIKQSSGPAW